MDALSRRLEVMDSTALSLCMENELPIVVFDVGSPEGIVRAVRGEGIGTQVGAAATVLSPA
jgi:uridylate kinase